MQVLESRREKVYGRDEAIVMKRTLKNNKTTPRKKPPGRPWKPGESGNPAGRPPNPESITNLMREVGNMIGPDGRTRKEALVEKLWKLAEGGNMRAAEYLIDRQEGKPRERHDINASGMIDFYTLSDVERKARIDELNKKRAMDAANAG